MAGEPNPSTALRSITSLSAAGSLLGVDGRAGITRAGLPKEVPWYGEPNT